MRCKIANKAFIAIQPSTADEGAKNTSGGSIGSRQLPNYHIAPNDYNNQGNVLRATTQWRRKKKSANNVRTNVTDLHSALFVIVLPVAAVSGIIRR